MNLMSLGQRMALIAFLFVTAPVAMAQKCRVVRVLNGKSVQDAFAAYQRSYAACGVENAALPFIKMASNAKNRGTIVMIHGLAGNPDHMRTMANRFSSAGFNVVAPLLRGHGSSDEFLAANAGSTQWKQDVQFAGNIAAAIGGPLFLVGHSTGGAIAILEAAANPGKYKAIATMDPALNLNGPELAKAPLACGLKEFATFETDRLISWIAGRKHVNEADYINALEASERQSAKRYCSESYKLPPHNHHFTLAGICALDGLVKELKRLSPQGLPPTMMLESRDGSLFGPRVSREDAEAFIKQIPVNAIEPTLAPVHRFMVADCSPDYINYLTKIQTWLDKHSGAEKTIARVESETGAAAR